MSLKLNVIIGSTRPGRMGPAIGRWFADQAAARNDFEVELVDLADFALPLLDEAAHPMMRQYAHEHTKRWSASVASADAYVFITPEYDYFPPASLVNAVQSVMIEWIRKPAGVVSYGGISGGLRGAQGLRQLLSSVNVHSVPQGVPIPNFFQFMTPDGFAPSQPVVDGAKVMLDEVHLWAGALKGMRTAA